MTIHDTPVGSLKSLLTLRAKVDLEKKFGLHVGEWYRLTLHDERTGWKLREVFRYLGQGKVVGRFLQITGEDKGRVNTIDKLLIKQATSVQRWQGRWIAKVRRR